MEIASRRFPKIEIMPNPKKSRTPCLSCGAEPDGFGYKYCSNSCQQEFQYRSFIRRWSEGKEHGLNAMGIVGAYVKRYLREKFDNRCVLCGWSELNMVTGVVPLVADHIDGNWRNNTEGNLRLLCPNCDSLTPTFSALNKGNGRPGRALSKRTQEAREMYRRRARP